MRATEPEQAVVALALRDPGVFDEVGLEPEHFGEFPCRKIWSVIGTLRDRGDDVDELTVLDALAGHPAGNEIAKLAASPASTRSLKTYTKSIRAAYLGRKVLEALSEISSQSKEMNGEELIQYAVEAITRIDINTEARGIAISDMARERMRQLDQLSAMRERGEVAFTGLPTGVAKLDEILGGIQRGIGTVVAARPAMGKSSFAMGVADTVSSMGVGVHVFSLEDTRDAYIDRAISRRSRVPSVDIRTLKLSRQDMSSMSRAVNELGRNEHWFIDDGSGLTANELISNVRRKRRELGTELVIVDYLTLLAWPKGVNSRYEAVTRNIDILCNAARRDGMAYLIVSQLNRGLEQRADKHPMLSDLRESGAIEERAKCVLFLYRGAVYGDEGVAEEDIEILVEKNSNGQTGVVNAKWDGPTTTVK